MAQPLLALAVERQRLGVFRVRDMQYQFIGRQSTLDDGSRERRGNNRLTAISATVANAHDDQLSEPTRDEIQFLAAFLADLDQCATVGVVSLCLGKLDALLRHFEVVGERAQSAASPTGLSLLGLIRRWFWRQRYGGHRCQTGHEIELPLIRMMKKRLRSGKCDAAQQPFVRHHQCGKLFADIGILAFQLIDAIERIREIRRSWRGHHNSTIITAAR